MLEKVEILIIIFVLLAVFYLVIQWGAGNKKTSSEYPAIKNYLFGVRILISIIAIVGFILWLFI